MTTDPLALIQSNSVEQRAEATRYYERHGDLKDIDVLLESAINDTSIAIRNNAADAIYDILSRYRIGERKKLLSRQKRLDLLQEFRKVSPNKSPVVYLMYAALGIPEVFPILTSAFFDPRTELRISAAIGLKCYCLSADLLDSQQTEQGVLQLLENQRLDGDSLAHVARVCAEAGYTSALSRLQKIHGEGLIGETMKAATEQLKKAQRRPVGIWTGDEMDAMEFNPDPVGSSATVIISSESAAWYSEGEWRIWSDFDDLPQRQLLFRRISQPTPGPALQVGLRTWYMADAKQVEDLFARESKLDGERCDALVVLADVLQSRAGDDPKMWRNIAVLYLRSNELSKAESAVQKSAALKRPPKDIWYVQGEVHRRRGEIQQAESSFQKCLAGTRSEKSALARLCTLRLKEMEN